MYIKIFLFKIQDAANPEKWHSYVLAGIHLERYINEEDAFLQCIVAIGQMVARAYEPELIKNQSNDWHLQNSSRPEKFQQEFSRMKFMLIVAYGWNLYE